MTLETSIPSSNSLDQSWAEQWRLSFKVDGFIEEQIADLLSEEYRHKIGRSGLFLYSEHSARVQGTGDRTDPRYRNIAHQVEHFSDYINSLDIIDFGRLFEVSHQRMGVQIKAAAHLGRVATGAIRRDERLTAGRDFLSGTSAVLRLVIPTTALHTGVHQSVDQVRRNINSSMFGNESGGVQNENERAKPMNSEITAGPLLKNRLKRP